MANDKSKIFFWVFVIVISVVCFVSLFIFKPVVAGDGFSYVDTIKVIQGGNIPSDFVPNKMIANFYGLGLIILLSKIFGNVELGWILLNITLFFVSSIIFYKIIRTLFESDKTAFIASLFFATNYAVISFGLAYLMDIGGWAFYLLSLYLTLKYVQTGDRKMLLYSAVVIGFGGLFKEYAFLGVIPIAIVLAYENWPKFITIIKKGLVPALIVFVPAIPVYLVVYKKFGYTYATWLSSNQEHYVYAHKYIEYIKSLGSLYNFLAFLFIDGIFYFIYNRKELVADNRLRVFIISVSLSILPVFIWPAITQRILFITVPAAIVIASFMFKKWEKYWWVFILPLILYIVVNFNMNYVLSNFNLPF
jgi:4-amino-4-deoxy-L-arabinose transferase-like glycosyltransferase